MPVTIGTSTKQITTERTIRAFGVTIPDDGQPCWIEVAFSEVDKDESGVVVAERHLPAMKITQERALEILPTAKLPDFATMYSGLSELFHAEYQTQNPPAA